MNGLLRFQLGFLCLLLPSLFAEIPEHSPLPALAPNEKWIETFIDDFDSNYEHFNYGLSKYKWALSKNNQKHKQGFRHNSLVARELDSDSNYIFKLKVKKSLEDDHCFAQTNCKNIDIKNPKARVPVPTYVTAAMSTQGKFTQQYGYFETRVKLPKEIGYHFAFWLQNLVLPKESLGKLPPMDRGKFHPSRRNPTNANPPKENEKWRNEASSQKGLFVGSEQGREIDIVEYSRSFGNKYDINIHTHQSIDCRTSDCGTLNGQPYPNHFKEDYHAPFDSFYGKKNPSPYGKVKKAVPLPHPDDWNLFGLEWDPHFLKFYLNGVLVHTIEDPLAIPHRPSYLMLTNEVDHEGWYPKSTEYPDDEVLIDYVRVFQKRRLDLSPLLTPLLQNP